MKREKKRKKDIAAAATGSDDDDDGTVSTPTTPVVDMCSKRTMRRRKNPKVVARREMRKMQRQTGSNIQKASFKRLVREIANEYAPGVKFEKAVYDLLRRDLECYLFDVCVGANLCARTGGCVTVGKKHLQVQQYINGHRAA